MAEFAEVIVPVPLPVTFTYRIPADMQSVVGPMFRVVVPFGQRKYYTGIVESVSDHKEAEYDLKEIAMCPDTKAVLRRPQLQLWNWIADYYMCPIGDVLKAALPAGLKLESETVVELNGEMTGDETELNLKGQSKIVYETLRSVSSCTVKDLERAGVNDAMRVVYSLVKQGIVTVHERLNERFRPKKEEYFTLQIVRGDAEVLKTTFDKLRSERHQKLLMVLLTLSDFMKTSAPLKPVTREALAETGLYDRAILKSFEKKGIIKIDKREISRFKWTDSPLKDLPVLSDAQKIALKETHASFEKHSVSLLHGVTSSGKTEIFIQLIDYTLKLRKQVLYLVPEIALTTQLTRRLQAVFGPQVVIYHSRFSDAERVEIWYKLLTTNEPLVVIGARSSVFLPFASLGLVIVDEEHEQSYKQFDPAPRYNARDVAMMLARLHGAKTLLASATPTVETYYKAKTGKYGLVSLTERYGDISLPSIEVLDMGKAHKKGEVDGSLAGTTVKMAREALQRNEQVIFFHNRRGYSPVARCKSCEFIPRCSDCDVSLTYHRNIDRLVCHYCGKEYAMPSRCPVCKEPTMEVSGFGTERVEENIAATFPDSRVLRMDLDTTRNKDNYSDIIDTFSEGKADILVGTQMVTKGLDFGKVSTVAVLNADLLLNYPDFRATERTFNMLEQVSGRAGRRNGMEGKVVVQTRHPEHPVMNYLLKHDYEGFYNYELSERESFGYPPFTRLIYIFVRHREEGICDSAAKSLDELLTSQLGNRIFGPHTPAVSRVKNMYLRRIMVKVEAGVSLGQVRSILKAAVEAVKGDRRFRGIDIYFDVDPA